eukprot:GHVQ01012734.1.p1 GENE.GHVQ01012734.1~~GHVQ01012734.1.p1  ORF type:complete len:399 (-),score=65.64 GHVQ01012734.1:248-1444(-)
MYTISPVEACRTQVLLEEGLKKLEFLGSISQLTQSLHRDELSVFMGDEISRILTQLKDLEAQYEQLILQKSELKGLTNKLEATQLQHKMQQVSHKLGEANKSLCRNLKENPNIQGNLVKMQQERQRVEEWYKETTQELNEEFSFYGLLKKVEAERNQQEMLNEVKKREREASQAVRALESELQREHAEHEKETSAANTEISSLKEQLQRDQMKAAIRLSFAEKQLRATESALLRGFAQDEQLLQKKLQERLAAQSLEENGVQQVVKFLHERTSQLQQEKSKRQEIFNSNIKRQQEDLQQWQSLERAAVTEELQRLKTRKEIEEKEQAAKEEEEQRAMTVQLLRSQQQDRDVEAITVIQHYGRMYLRRLPQIRAKLTTSSGKTGKTAKKRSTSKGPKKK